MSANSDEQIREGFAAALGLALTTMQFQQEGEEGYEAAQQWARWLAPIADRWSDDVPLVPKIDAAIAALAVEPVALTDAQIDALWDRAQGSLLPNFYCLDQRPVLRNRIFARAVLAAAQEVEFTDDPVPTYKPGPPLEWEKS